jgi:PAS domain S-box-containing protein
MIMHKEHLVHDRISHMLNIQHDIEYYSWLQGGLNESLAYILTKLTEVDWIDAGGVYLVDEENDLIQLKSHLGLSDEFIRGALTFGPNTSQYKVLHKKEKFYITGPEIIEAGATDVIAEGLRFLAVLPLVDHHQLVGSLNLASRRIHKISDHEKFFVENIASRITSMVVHIRTQDEILKSRERLNQKVRERTLELEKMNQKLKKEIKVHKKTKKALEISENLYRSVFNNARDGIVLYDAHTFKLIDLNIQAHIDLGYTREEFFELKPADYIVYQYEGQREEILQKLFSQKSVVYNVKHITKQGETKFRIMNVSLIEIGSEEYILGIIHDVTRLRITESQLEIVERNFQEMMQRISIGMFRYNMKTGSFLFMNTYARYLLGVGDAEDVSKLTLHQLGLSRIYSMGLLKQLGPQGELKNHEIWITRPNGSKFLGNVNLSLFNSGEYAGTQFIDGTIDDITQFRQAQIELELANQLVTEMNNSLKQRIDDALKMHDNQQAVILQKSKLESLGELAAGIAHEINQPVGIISLSLENLMARFEAGTMTPAYLHKKFDGITEHINRIRKIIENIRIFSRDQGTMTLEKVFLKRIVNKAVSLIKTQYTSHHVTLKLDLNDNNEFTVGSRVKVEQVLYNLLSNAKYAVDEREVLTQDPGYKKIIRIASGVEGGNRLFLEVEDNGTGISEQNLPRVFDPFFSTKNEFKGTGLGLSVIFGIIHEMKGQIHVESDVNHYTKFRIVFPMFPEKD